MLENIIDKESRGFLNGFVSRVGRAFFPLILSSGLLLNSCTSTSQYYDYREREGSHSREEKVLLDTLDSREIKYNISEGSILVKDNFLQIPVFEEKYEKRMIKKRKIN